MARSTTKRIDIMTDEKKKFNVTLGEKALEALMLLSNATKMTPKEILRNAIGFYMWAFTEWKSGNRIGSIKENDETDTVYFIKLAFMENEDEDSDSGIEKLSELTDSKKLFN